MGQGPLCSRCPQRSPVPGGLHCLLGSWGAECLRPTPRAGSSPECCHSVLPAVSLANSTAFVRPWHFLLLPELPLRTPPSRAQGQDGAQMPSPSCCQWWGPSWCSWQPRKLAGNWNLQVENLHLVNIFVIISPKCILFYRGKLRHKTVKLPA